MRIRLAILEQDENYLNRIVSAFSTRYADKFEIYSFTDAEIAMNTLEGAKIDVLVADDAFETDFSRLPKKCGFAYFVDSMDVDTLNGQHAICKFQKADLIYKQILSVYSEHIGNVTGLKLGDDSARIIVFTSASGGVGTSTMAAACAVRLASEQQKTLYLNLEAFGSSDAVFSSEGQFDMSDIIFALKSKKTNLPLKLESCVKQDSRGVYFYSQSKIALDMLELNAEDMLRLISELKLTGGYRNIIVDMDFGMTPDTLQIYRQAQTLVWVGDGSETSNAKLSRAYKALATLEQNNDAPLTNRLLLAYNKFSNKTGSTIEDMGVKCIGGAPRYEHATEDQIVGQLSTMDMLDQILE